MHNVIEKDVGKTGVWRGLIWKIDKKPQKYIHAQPELKSRLKELKKKGKHLFVVTNSTPSFMSVVLKATLGDKWKTYFDVVVSNCKKPLFQQSNGPFYSYDVKSHNLRGKKCDSSDKLLWQCTDNDQTVFIGGNAKALTEYFQKVTQKSEIRIAYLGNHVTNDVLAVHGFNKYNRKGSGYGDAATWEAINTIQT
jgi:hypothetical protein